MLLSRDLRFALDQAAFAEACGIVPDKWQADLLTGNDPKVLLNCCRQAGKSTATALCGLHTVLYGQLNGPPALVLIVSPSERQSAETFKKAMGFYRALGSAAPELATESALRAEWRNGSRLIALPGSGDTIRSYSSVDLLILDEASRIPDGLLAAVRPMLAVSRGRMIVLSTPAGRRGFFFEAWEHGQDWRKIRITAEQCPRISAEFLESERRDLGPLLYSAEYECCFVDDNTSVFSSELVERCFRHDVEPLFRSAAA